MSNTTPAPRATYAPDYNAIMQECLHTGEIGRAHV